MQKETLRALWKQFVSLAVIGIIIISAVVPFIFNESMVKDATLVAKSTVHQYAQLRSYYAKNVVRKLEGNELLSTSKDYKNTKNSIPLPDTMIQELMSLSTTDGLTIKLHSTDSFSDFTKDTTDTFQEKALRQFSTKPNTPYIIKQKIEGIHSLRVAIADIVIEKKCVTCFHNKALNGGSALKPGDLRGIFEIVVPIEHHLLWQYSSSFKLSLILIALFSIIFLYLSYILNKESKKQVNSILTPLNNQKFAMNAHSLVSMADMHGKITYVNDNFSDISGYSKAELLGKKHSVLNSNNQAKGYWENMHDTVLSGEIWHDEVRNKAKDGHYYWVDTTIVPTYDDQQEMIGFVSVRTDITQKKEEQVQLAIAKELAESAKFALDQHSLVSVTDIKGTITYVNNKFVEISGYKRSELIGKKHSLLNSENQPKAYWKSMFETVLAGDVWHDEVRNKAKNGKYYWVDTTIVPNFNTNNRVIGYTSIRTDISEQKVVLEKLVLAKEQAEVASKSKADFLANMSHEIRTPMNGVIGMTNLLLNTDLNNQQMTFANTVRSSAVGLLSIINDILDFSKVEAGKLDLELIPLNLGKMVEDVGKIMSFQANEKNLEFICPANPIIQQCVNADAGRLRQILTNLIGNAIKFTERGEVAVFVKLIEQTDTHKTFRFEITDSGIGISEEQQINLFDKFTQADTSTTRKYGGTGLGLSISKQLVELMGGEVGVISQVDQGSTFWFTVELLKAEALTEQLLYSANLSSEKILIVDDNKTNRELMSQLHDIWNIPHTLVGSAKAALLELEHAAAKNDPYSIAILDMHMPDTDGLVLCEQIQKIPTLAKTKLIMASSQAQRGDARIMKKAGFKGYITKPIHQSELFDILLMVSGLHKEKSDFITRHSARDKTQYQAHVLVVEDNATNQLVIEGMLSAIGVTTDIVANGQEAIAALQNIGVHDLVFMDCQMPILDGYAATQIIRAGKAGTANPNIPIIAMTANAMAGDKQKCLDSGMDDYLSKPLMPSKLIDMLEKWLPEENKISGVQEKVIVKQPIHDVLVFDYQDMYSRLMEDTDLMNSVAEVFCKDLVKQIAQLKASVNDNDVSQATAILHQIKGASVNVGGKALGTLALTMEQAGKSGNIDTIKANLAQLDEAFYLLKSAMKEALS